MRDERESDIRGSLEVNVYGFERSGAEYGR